MVLKLSRLPPTIALRLFMLIGMFLLSQARCRSRPEHLSGHHPEGLVNEDFIREQTDLAMLVRKDSARFYVKVICRKMAPKMPSISLTLRVNRIEAPPTLELARVVPALEGTFEVTLKDGGVVEVEPAIVRLRRHLESYKPERQQLPVPSTRI